MADTIAVMNAGRIEQMGNPADIYELPRTVFVANFLGQSNLIPGTQTGKSGENAVINAHGVDFRVPGSRVTASGSAVVVGVRPEKITIIDAVDAAKVPEHHNRLEGTVTDVSYTGVSTQYLVRVAWGAELVVFEQNRVEGDRCEVGDRVILHWATEHTFGLDGTQGLTAGIERSVLDLERADGTS